MAVAIEITFDDSHLQTVLEEVIVTLPSMIKSGVEEGARRVNEAIRNLEPHGSGELQAVTGEYDPSYLEGDAEANPDDAVFWVGSIGNGEYAAIVGTNLLYAKYLNDGFTAGEKQIAKFYEGGNVLYRTLTPGKYYPGRYFFEQGAEEGQADYQRIMQNRINIGLLEAATSVTVDSKGRVLNRGKAGRFLGEKTATRINRARRKSGG